MIWVVPVLAFFAAWMLGQRIQHAAAIGLIVLSAFLAFRAFGNHLTENTWQAGYDSCERIHKR